MLSNTPFLLCWTIIFVAGVSYLIRRRWRIRKEAARELAGVVRREDALKHLCKSEANGRVATVASVAGTLHLNVAAAASLLGEMEQRGLVTFSPGYLRLTPGGRASGLHIVRAHRLWETYLANQTGVEKLDWHDQAEDREHALSFAQLDTLATDLGHPTRDPHGDEIPSAGGALSADAGRPLSALAPGQVGHIVHLEDEPRFVHTQLLAEGLRLGSQVRVLENNDRCIRFWAEGDEHVLAPLLAQNVDVLPLRDDAGRESETSLADLKPGEHALVRGLAQDCRGPERQRLLDLGFVPGSEIEVEMNSPTGDTTAYRVRGTVIALRHEQARLVGIRPAGPVGSASP